MLLLVTTKYIYMVTKLFVVTENPTVDLVVVFAFIFVIPFINFSIRHDLSIDQLENLCISIKRHKSKPFLVSTWYRPPSSPVENFKYFESLLSRLDSENIEFYLLGDLNCDLSFTVLDHGSRLLVDIANLFSLTQLIEEPTRITSSSSTLIDHIFTNSPDKISCAGVSHVSISDHSLIYAYRKLSNNRPTKGHSSVNYRSFKIFDPAKFRHDIENQNWAYVGEFEDPDEMWHVWKAIFNSAVDKHAPFRTKRVRASKSPWISSQLKNEMHKRDAKKITEAVRSNDHLDWFLFKKMRNSVNQNIFRAKESYFKDTLFANKNNPKKKRGALLTNSHLI